MVATVVFNCEPFDRSARSYSWLTNPVAHMRRTAILIGITCYAACAAVAQAGQLPDATASRIDALASALLARKASDPAPVTALSLAIGSGGELLLARGFGLATPSQRADAATLYHVGSLTKQFVAAAVLRLSTRSARARTTGALMDVDSPVGLFFEKADLWGGEAPVTLRKLLTMTSNLPNFTRRPPRGVDPWGSISSQQLLDRLQHQAPHGLGSSFEYSNTNYFLLAAVLESVVEPESAATTSYYDRLRQEVFRPALMHDTRFIADAHGDRVLAAPHYRRSRPAFNSPDWLKGSADVVSNVRDIFAWNKALMEGRVLAPELRSLMFSDNARVGPLQYYGMGWFVEHEADRDIYFHSGTVPGYSAFNLIAVENTGTSRWTSVTLLANSDAVEDLDELATAILEFVPR